ATDTVGRERFKIMEKRLSILMSIAAVATIVFGIWLIGMLGWGWFMNTGWIHAKILLVVLLLGFHGWCQAQVKKFREDRASGSAGYFRLMNEVPTFFLVAIVVLAIVKPF
ncbi:MAG: TIGR00701 family protein, partial [Xanthomonadales bacterium]|nr:TIGR00701 family protein [Xanthomonadales bacterium]